MDFDFSDDQEQLRDAVRKWVDKGYDFERRRAIVAAGGFDRAAYTELAELGLTGLYVSEDNGGMGMGPTEAMVTLEELGRGIVLEPLTQTLINGHAVSSGDWFVLDQTGAGVGRSVSFSLLPSELVSRVEVHKNASASDIEGGTAGTV